MDSGSTCTSDIICRYTGGTSSQRSPPATTPTDSSAARAAAERAAGVWVIVQPLKKNAKFQVETLEKEGYTHIQKVFGDTQLD